MNIKQKDAGYLRCPMPSGYLGEDGTMYCSGTGCMMWRWTKEDVDRVNTEDRKGYCGLAGRPL